jgi:hypothetical protein
MTPREGLERQIAIYRQMTGAQRLQVGFELYELARALVRAGVRQQHPAWEDAQIEQEVVRRFLLARDGIR